MARGPLRRDEHTRPIHPLGAVHAPLMPDPASHAPPGLSVRCVPGPAAGRAQLADPETDAGARLSVSRAIATTDIRAIAPVRGTWTGAMRWLVERERTARAGQRRRKMTTRCTRKLTAVATPWATTKATTRTHTSDRPRSGSHRYNTENSPTWSAKVVP